jgi:hypothetical protein
MRRGNGDQARRLLSGRDFALCLCSAMLFDSLKNAAAVT